MRPLFEALIFSNWHHPCRSPETDSKPFCSTFKQKHLLNLVWNFTWNIVIFLYIASDFVNVFTAYIRLWIQKLFLKWLLILFTRYNKEVFCCCCKKHFWPWVSIFFCFFLCLSLCLSLWGCLFFTNISLSFTLYLSSEISPLHYFTIITYFLSVSVCTF